MSAVNPIFLALDIPPVILGNLSWIVGGLIVVVGLLGFGLKDVIRFQFRRVWAISGVCFDESIRRRILWITPLAIMGVIVVSQLQKPSDEQDAIRQTTKFCLFATGLVVTISTVILACTNLPREIENRVIYTIVTKPTTRLEIVLGKILGFARVSAAILIIMGLFTWGYLWIRERSMVADIKLRLDANVVDPVSRPTLEHYREVGLLNAKSFATTSDMGIFSRLPAIDNDRRYFNEGFALVPIVLPADVTTLVDADGKPSADPGMIIRARVGYERAAHAPSTTAPSAAQVVIQIFDPNQNALVTQEVNGGKPVDLTSPDGTLIQIPVLASAMSAISKVPFIYIAIVPAAGDAELWIDSKPVQVIVPVGSKAELRTIEPSNPTDPSKPAEFLFTGRQGLDGQQIHGDTPDKATVGLFPFNGLNIAADSNATVPFELRVSIENSGDDADVDAPTRIGLQARNRTTGKVVDLPDMWPENNRTAFGKIPAAALAGGNFDLIIRCLTPQHWVGLKTTSIAIVQSETSFAMNLVKSLSIIWLLTVLVISISIFSSTFLSWPIAIVLTLLILLGHWGVEELGDAAQAGLGRQFVQDFGVRDPAQAQAISATVERLNKVLAGVSAVLPDIDRFPATEDIERGISIPSDKLFNALLATLCFGLPLSVLAYVFLKNKEVAP
jgi:hypothetical protein